MDRSATLQLSFLLMKRDFSKKADSTVLDEALLRHIWEALDETPHSPQSKRVRHILNLLLDLKESRATLQAVLVVLPALGKAVERYRWAYQVGITNARVKAGLRGVGRYGAWEYGAVFKLLEIIQKPGGLDRLYRCEFCGKTLFATNVRGRRPKFCPGGLCKQRSYDGTPENRDKKAAYQRKYYKDWIAPR
jgi:hypothetical protein